MTSVCVLRYTAATVSERVESLGSKLRAQRRRLGLTLDELAARTGISKPYLSLIETGRVVNPPSDEKLVRLEQALGFAPGELVTEAHLMRTPRDIRHMLQSLLRRRSSGDEKHAAAGAAGPVNLDDAYASGVLREIIEQSAPNVERVVANAVPVINRVAAGYPQDFTDLGYPPRVADEYISCPALEDKDAFAARVYGDSMLPNYREGDIVVFSPAACPRSGDDCFVRFADGSTTFKRVFFETDDRGEPVVRLQPRNEKYRPQIVSAEQIAGVYPAMYRYERVNDREE